MADYITTRLITDTEDEFLAECELLGFTDAETGELIKSGVGFCFDVIHPYMSKSDVTTQATDDDGTVYNVYVYDEIEGYHVNQRANFLTGLEHLESDVTTPIRKFAGE